MQSGVYPISSVSLTKKKIGKINKIGSGFFHHNSSSDILCSKVETNIQSLIKRSLQSYQENEKTFKDIPVVVHQLMVFIYHQSTNKLNYLTERKLGEFPLHWDGFNKKDVEIVKSYSLLKCRNKTIKELIQLGFTEQDSLTIKEECKSVGDNYFTLLNTNGNISNEDFVRLISTSQKYSLGELPVLVRDKDTHFAFVLLKYFFLCLPKPMINDSVLKVFEMGLSMKNKLGIERVRNYLMGEIENIMLSMNEDSPCAFLLFKEMILFMRAFVEQNGLNGQEKEELYLCYFNAMLQNNSFKKEFLPLVDLMFFEQRYNRDINELFPYEKEVVIKKYEFAFCPLFCVGLTEEFDTNDAVPGSVYFTSHRIIFMPDSQLNQRELNVLKYLGCSSICNILGVQVSQNEHSHCLRIICKDLRVLSFRIVGPIQPYEEMIQNIIQHYRYPTETEYLYCTSTINNVIINEVKRMGIEGHIESINMMSVNVPICQEVYHINEKDLKAVICYQHSNGSQLIRFPLLKNVYADTVLSSSTIKMKEGYQFTISKYDIIGEHEISEMVNKIQELLPTVNTKNNQNISYLFEASNRISDEIRTTLDYTFRLVKQITTKQIHLILISNKNCEKGLCVLSGLIQLVVDPHYRTINGFMELIQKDFISFCFFENDGYEYSNYFILFLLCINFLYRQNNYAFEFDERLIQLTFHSIFSHRFYEFNHSQVNSKSSFISLVQYYSSEFVNPLYQRSNELLKNELIEGDYCALIYKWLNYSKKCTKVFTSDILSTKNIGLGIYSFPPIDICISSFSTLRILDLSSNRLKDFPVELLQLPQLIELNLNDNDIFYITPRISQLSNLTSLSLGNNCLVNLPELSNIPLRKLDLSSNDFPRNFQFELGNDLEYFNGSEFLSYPTILGSLPNITSLNFSHVRFDILDIINNPPRSLQELKLSGCRLPIIPEEITRLALTGLDVSDNYISKMNYSFFSMSSLRVLNISSNHVNGTNALFKTMKQLKVIANNVIPRKTKLSLISIPSLKTMKQMCNDGIRLMELECIIITGSLLRKEIFTILQKKFIEEGSIQMNEEHSLTFEFIDKKKKEKKSLVIIEMSIEQLLNDIWRLRRSLFIVCKQNKESSEEEVVLELLKMMEIHGYIHIICNEEINVKEYINVDNNMMDIEYYCYMDNKKKKTITCLWNKLFKQINKLVIEGDENCFNLLNELSGLRIPGFCLTIGKIKEIIQCLGMKEWQKVLNWLTRNGYLLTDNDFRDKNQLVEFKDDQQVLVDWDLFPLTSKTIQKNCDKNGFLCVNIFELLGIKNDTIKFILRLLEKNGFLIQITKDIVKPFRCQKQFENVFKYCSEQSSQLKKYSQTTSSSSALSSNGSWSSIPIIVTEKIELSNVILYTFHDYKDSFNKDIWPEQHLRNEIEIGRVIKMKVINYKAINLIISILMLKYTVHSYWKNGAIVIVQKDRNLGKLYVLIEGKRLSKTIEIRIRGLINDVEIPFLMVNTINTIFNEIKIICQQTNCKIERIDALCNECLSKGIKTVIPNEIIKQNINSFIYNFKWKEHEINSVACLLDFIIDSFPKHCIDSLDQYNFINDIGTGSNSTISLFERKGNKELMVLKLGNIDFSVTGINKETTAIQLFTSILEEFLREINFINFPSHQSIAKIYGYSLYPLFVTIEYFNGGSLYSLINQNHYEFSLHEKIQIAKQIAEGINFLHTYKIPLIHCDIKSPNVLIKLDNNKSFVSCAISDFGETVPAYASTSSKVECPYWLAPEVISGNAFTQKSDVYSYAIVLWELSTNKTPFSEFKFFSEIREKVLMGYRPTLNEKMTIFNSLITHCWNADQTLRPTMKEVLVQLESITE
ncbi:hypothetical protein ENUP19_0341G0052 [Entamoeba nuttalli]|uniref:Uncharacterized protein n=1 Tax=Entamoeba nuttalli TaxID=412467 RepID=A0ABQ0DXE4_9EUKA